MELLFWTQWGNLPSIVNDYDLRVTADLGIPNITDAYAYLRPQVVASKVRVLQKKQQGETASVGIEMLSKQNPPMRESFLLRRSRGEWRVLFDTLLQQGLNGSAQNRVAPGAAKPSRRAVREGERAAQRYRIIYPSIQLNRRLQSGQGQSEPAPTG